MSEKRFPHQSQSPWRRAASALWGLSSVLVSGPQQWLMESLRPEGTGRSANVQILQSTELLRQPTRAGMEALGSSLALTGCGSQSVSISAGGD